MIYQTDKEFPFAVNHWGCYMMSILERLTTRFDMPFTHDWVLEARAEGVKQGIIDAENTILDPQRLCDIAVGKNKVRFLGKQSALFDTRDNELEVLCFHKDGASFNHFVSGNGRGIVIYDPWGPQGSDSVKNGKIIGKRIFQVV